ncbi:hypothetical protein COT99_01440 [Candidatus Falkowbacteria bacterium CG10_big_fil_rev_8_21_14_0_10_43_10]|uniref:Uncharacterized protein n=1 Tax=Candidatus Falkowbacteria bacterium CG10_big_fil_rev_8_21_14_0_10_43_10 TaxID=1974567 RepID=A0A2H0V2I0_9BACT|nr:MAG: hypothetical protein COT99_01440 [Candidatus Falkowbacteria bacterium CG10_big_fil_rev_8_21_14_0_10_43_10]
MQILTQTLIKKINGSDWWHVPPKDHGAYQKRGKFLASTFLQAAFYGRPNDMPERVKVANPVYGTSEAEIIKQLFPNEYKKLELCDDATENWYQKRIALDGKICKRAKQIGYDAVVLLVANGKEYLRRGRKPHSMELNIL